MEALAYFLFKEHFDALQCSRELDVILFLDFGGHSMNSCIFNVVYSGKGKRSFY